ncbi:PDZK1-interacting protein 1 [Esox lucius]|uniref:PDZK1-interacting protein 1 n=1 Tax=Esox lucius TaxID=8010 RepID=A0AAY5K6L3_ESOLU|nr:PDZK1-interacting protein 1 [Esox lucius]
MGRATVILWLMMTAGVVTAQTGEVVRALPQWLTGIIALSVFLFLVFVTFLVNKAWCQDRRPETKAHDFEKTTNYANTNGEHNDIHLDMVRSIENEVVYENAALDGFEDKVTSM